MSRFERAYCCSSVWRSTSSGAIARELCAQRLGRDVLEIGVGVDPLHSSFFRILLNSLGRQ
jgi:hypothetical protein